jgi:hypothetical protein
MEILEYIEWCKINNKRQIVNIQSSEDCTKNEILDYAEWLNKNHHKLMNNKEYKSENAKLLKCWDCKYQKNISKGLGSGGTQTYIILCKKESICFEANWNEHISDLPCHDNLKLR